MYRLDHTIQLAQSPKTTMMTAPIRTTIVPCPFLRSKGGLSTALLLLTD